LNLVRFLEKDDPVFLNRLTLYAVEKVRRLDHPKVAQVRDAQDLPEIEGCAFSFELFDALPCHALIQEADGLRELYVENGAWAEGPVSDPSLNEYIKRFSITPGPGQRFEVCLEAESLYDLLVSKLKNGVLLTFDYGAKASTLYRSSNYPDGTLMSHLRHQFDRDVLKDPGSKDITYAINFAALMEEGEKRGLTTEKMESLSAFLSEAGAGLPPEWLQQNDPFPARDLLFGTIGQDIKVLIQSHSD
jgi:SAM-dependent MidA family methyltransferase